MTEHASIIPQPKATAAAAKTEVLPDREIIKKENGFGGFQHPSLQRKLAIGAIDDPLEKEADSMADKVMRMPDLSFIQSKSAQYEKGGKVQRKPLALFIQRKDYAETARANDAVSDQINASKRHGSGMDETLGSVSSSYIQLQSASPSGSHPPAKDGGLSNEELKRIALQLHNAMAGLGTDEEAIYSALSGRTQEQVDAIAKVYQTLYGQPLLADLQDELNDAEMEHLAIFSPAAAPKKGSQSTQVRADLIAIRLRNAMRGWGTNEESIFAALTGRSESERQEIKTAYKNLTNRELEADLSDELSGSALEKAMKLLNHGILSAEEEGFWSKLWGGIKSVAGTVWKGVKAFAGWAWDVIKSGAAWVWDLITWLPSRLWSLIKHVGAGIAGIASWLWDLVHVIQGDIGLSEWIVNGIISGAAWAGRLIGKVSDLFGVGEMWTFINNIIKFNSRTLTDTEKEEAQKVYSNSISYWQVRIDEKSLISVIGAGKSGAGMGVVTAHTINFNHKINATPGSSDMAWLIHELGHVAQYTHVGLQYLGEAVHAQATAGYDYGGGAALSGKNLRDFNREQQPDILRDYYKSVLYTGSFLTPEEISDYTRMRDQAVKGMF